MGGKHEPIIAPTMREMRWIELLTAVLAACLGWVGIALILLGPTFGSATLSFDPSGGVSTATGTDTLLDVGVPLLRAFALLVAALALAGLVAGAWLHRRGSQRGRTLLALASLIVVAVTLANLAAAVELLPAASLSVIAAVVALAPLERQTAR